MQRIIGPLLALFGILAIIGLATGVAYTAGLNAAATTVTATGTTTVVPVVAYGAPWLGFGFGGFLFTIVGFFLILALVRAAFGAGRGHGRGYGRGHGWGPGYGHGPGGWDRRGPDGEPGGTGEPVDPREAWIRGRLDDWHRTAHASRNPVDPTSGPGPNPTPPAAG